MQETLHSLFDALLITITRREPPSSAHRHLLLSSPRTTEELQLHRSNMLPGTIFAGLLVAVATALPNAQSGSVSVSVYSTVDHITKYKPSTLCTGQALPTKTRTKAKTVTSTITTCSAPTTVTITITPDAVTITTYGNATAFKLRARQDAGCTSTTTVYVLYCEQSTRTQR